MSFRAIGFDYNGVVGSGSTVNAEVLQLVDSLRSKGYKTGLLSNFSRSSAERLRDDGIVDHFDAAHFSGETGFTKPQPEAFRNLAAELDVDIRELVFIDDSEYSLSTASETGFTPVLFTNSKELVAQLDQFGIKH